MSLKCELTKGHLTASQNKTEPKGLNKLASCTVFRTWCLFGKITVKYVWHIAFLDFKCIKKEPAFIDVVNQYLLQCKANAVGSTIPFTAHIFLEASYFFLWILFVQSQHFNKCCSEHVTFLQTVTKHSCLFKVHLFFHTTRHSLSGVKKRGHV